MLISKINLKNIKNIVLMHFQVKNTLKNNCYHNSKHYLILRNGLMQVLMIT
jgi:hypothetical protein